MSKAKTELEKTSNEDEKSVSTRQYEDFCEFVNEFKEESDRAAVVLGASKLDQMLGLVLERFLLPCPNSTDQLFANNGPLGTFSAKIDLCHRLGLIDSGFCKAIHLVRRIRNSFAHEVYGASLNNGSHKDRIKSLYAPIKNANGVSWLRERFFDGVDDSRADFCTTLGLMVARLDGLVEKLEPISMDNMQPLLPSEHNKQSKADA